MGAETFPKTTLILWKYITKKRDINFFFLSFQETKAILIFVFVSNGKDAWIIFCILNLPSKLDRLCSLRKVNHLNTLKYQDFVLYWKRNYLKILQFRNQFQQVCYSQLYESRLCCKLCQIGKDILSKEFVVDHRVFVSVFILFSITHFIFLTIFWKMLRIFYSCPCCFR